MLWAPNEGGGYPFNGEHVVTAAAATAELPAAESPAAAAAAVAAAAESNLKAATDVCFLV
jgi:hypothetical protein